MGRMDGKRVLVTGAASGLGRASALRLAEEGAQVLCTDVDAGGAEGTAKEIGERGHSLLHDVTVESQWEAAVAFAVERLGGLDALVNNAGIVVPGSIEETSLESWRRQIAVNLDGVFLGCKHGLEAMRERGGSIVNLSSIAGLVGQPPFVAYSASKGGVRLLTKSVAAHCLQLGLAVRCNSVHPGGIDTPMTRTLDPQRTGPATLAAFQKLDVSGPLGRPLDVANLVLFLASDESQLINGAEIAIDGGLVAL